jgi:hypothetical protein
MTAPNFGEKFLTITIEGADVVLDHLSGVEERMLDLRGVWPAVVRVFQSIVQRAFATEGASTADGPWPPLAPSTVRQRERQGYDGPHPILRRTEALYRALTIGDNVTIEAEPQRMVYRLGPEVGYFVFHQSAEPRVRLPRRAPVSFTEADRQDLVAPIALYIMGQDPEAPPGLGAEPHPPAPRSLG